jgi:hypothetical protein
MKTSILKKAGLAMLMILFYGAQMLIAQEEGLITIKGKVKDKETRKDIVFVSVTVPGNQYRHSNEPRWRIYHKN